MAHFICVKVTKQDYRLVARRINEMMKRLVKQVINTYPSINYQKLEDRLMKHDIVSFDVFDTLLKRNVSKVTDIFDVVENQWGYLYPDAPITHFKQQRLSADAKAYAKYGAATTLDNIYEFLNVPEGVKELEIEIELTFNVANEPVLEIFNKLKAANKKIYIISDMYLSSEVISEMLYRAGYQGYENLYVSCEFGKDKISGDLFELVSEDTGIAPTDFIHVGDSWKADWLGAKKNGVKSQHIALHDNRLPKQTKGQLNGAIVSLMNNHIVGHKYDAYQTFGYTTFGPILLGFIQWIQSNTPADAKKFFLARDGHIVQRAYELLYPESDAGHYLYVSRKSLKQPLLQYTDDFKDMATLLRLPSTYTIGELAIALGLNADEMNLSDADKIYTDPKFGNQPELAEFVTEHLNEIKQNSMKSADAFAQYLKQEGFEDNAQIIDIGWRGSMQTYLSDFMQKQGFLGELDGWYVGLNEGAKEQHISGYAYWFDMNNDSTSTDLATPFQGLLELLFSANHGTTIDYCEENGRVVPVLAPYEFEGGQELAQEDMILRSIRAAALDFVRDFQRSGLNDFVEVSAEEAFANLERIGLHPTLAETKQFGDLVFVDQHANALAKPQPMWRYLVNPKQLKYDVFESRWKIGFIKRLMKLPLNYHWLYKKMK
jgi:predicted HAD superfamily hydrolase